MFNVLCYKSKTLKNGENPLVIRVCKDGKKKYQSLGISINPVFWDFEKNKPKINCPNKDQILRLIAEQTKIFSEQVLEYKIENKDFTAKSLMDKVKNPVKAKTVKEVFDIQIKRLQDAKRLRYAEMHLLVLNSLIKFNGHLDIYFSDIDVTWLKNYETWLRANNLKENTIGLRFRTLRAIYNIAVEEKIVKKDYYPFDDYKVSKLKQKTAKRSIRKNEVLKVLNYKGKTDYERLSIDLFTFSYLTAGINFVAIKKLAQVFHFDLYGRRQEKYNFLLENDLQSIPWQELSPQAPDYFFVPKDFSFKEEYEKGFSIAELFPVNSSGVKTHNDDNLVSFTPFAENNQKYNYRPFDIRFINYDLKKVVRHRYNVMQHFLKGENLGLITTRQQNTFDFQHIVVAKNIVDMCALSSQTKETGYIFPLYLYQENFGQTEKVVNMNAAIGQNFPPLSFGEGQGVR